MAVVANRTVDQAPPRGTTGLSIVVPVFNEAKGLPRLHERLGEVARRLQAAHGIACPDATARLADLVEDLMRQETRP